MHLFESLHCFTDFVKGRVAVMKRLQAIYNLGVIRGDGHNDVASRVYEKNPDTNRWQNNFTCILAWCGTDCSLLTPFFFSYGESFAEQVADLEAFLHYCTDIQLEAGMTISESRPVVHATDNFGKHGHLWPAVYDRVWMAQRVGRQGVTPRGDVASVRLVTPSHADQTLVTGELFHDSIALDRALSALGNDRPDISHDHRDALGRLSAEMPPRNQDMSNVLCVRMSTAAEELLRAAVEKLVGEWTLDAKRRPMPAVN